VTMQSHSGHPTQGCIPRSTYQKRERERERERDREGERESITFGGWRTDKVRVGRSSSLAQAPHLYLSDCIHELFLESQLPHKTVNLLFTTTNGFVGELTF
jgi:hypothetical protein